MNETIEREKATARPWGLSFHNECQIIPPDSERRRAAIARTDLSHGLGDAGDADKANAELIVRAVNEHEALNVVAEDMKLILCTEFGSLINARKMAKGSGSIGYWAQVLNHYDALAAIRGGGK